MPCYSGSMAQSLTMVPVCISVAASCKAYRPIGGLIFSEDFPIGTVPSGSIALSEDFAIGSVPSGTLSMTEDFSS